MPIDPNQWSITPDINQPLNLNEWNITPDPPEKSWWDTAKEMGAAISPSIVGGAIGSFAGPWGTLAGSAIGSGAGELWRQYIADEPTNLPLAALETGIGAIPFGKQTAGLMGAVKYGAKSGLGQSLISTVPRNLMTTGELPTLGQAGTEALFGTTFGAATGGAMHYLPRPKPRIDAGAGAQNVDLNPPPPDLKPAGGSTTVPPSGPPLTGMDPSVDVSINDPARMAELKAQGYVFVGVNDNNARFVRPDLMNQTHTEPTNPITEVPEPTSEFIPVSQVEREFGMNSIKAHSEGYIELFTDAQGRTGFRRTGKQLEPPVREEPPIESYDQDQVSRGETPFTPSKDPLKGVPPLDIPLSEGEVEAKYRMSVAQAVHEGIVERVVQNGEVGYVVLQGDLDIGGIGGVRHIGDPNRGGSANEVPGEYEIRQYLRRMLGREPTAEEVQRAIDRQAREGDFTGRVAPFLTPEQRGQRRSDLGNIPPVEQRIQDSFPFLREGEGEPGIDLNLPPQQFDPTQNTVGPNGPREALAGFDQPRMGQQDLPFGPTPLPTEKLWIDKTMQELDYEGAYSPGGRLTPRPPAVPEGILPKQQKLPGGYDTFGGFRKIDPETGEPLPPIIRGGADEPPPRSIGQRVADIIKHLRQDVNRTDDTGYMKIMGDAENSIEGEVNPTIIKSNFDFLEIELNRAHRRGDPDEIEAIGSLRDTALDKLRQSTGQLPPGHTDVGDTRVVDLNQAMKINEPEMRMRKAFDKKHNTGDEYLDRALARIRQLAPKVMRDATAEELDDLTNAIDYVAGDPLTPLDVRNALTDMTDLYNKGLERLAAARNELSPKFEDEFNKSFKAWERQQNTPHGQGQLDLPLGRYEAGKLSEGFPVPKPRNELGQFITDAEAAKQQQDIPGLVSRTGIAAKPETIVTPEIKGGAPDVPPNQVPPGTRPPVELPPSVPPHPDEIPSSGGRKMNEKKQKELPIKSVWEQAYDAVRNLTTGLDISAPMRQGLPLIATKSWWTSWNTMLKAWGSQAAYDANLKSINDHYLFASYTLPDGKKLKGFGQRMGLRIDDIADVEEVTASKWLEKHFPGIKQSNRAYNAYLKKLRADTFTNLIEDAKRLSQTTGEVNNPFTDETLAREIAEFVNTASGAASLKMDVPTWMSRNKQWNFEQSAKQLGYLLFSPRQTFSRARMLNPLTYSNAPKYVRQQYMRAMISSVGAWGTIAGAAYMSGYADEVSLDPTSADFGKIRIGNTRLDVGGGFQQYMVATARLMSGQRTTAASAGGPGRTQVLGEGYQARTGLDVAQMFISNKLHPLTKFGYDFLAASEYQPFQVGDKIAQIAIPLYMQDAYEIITQDRPEILPLLFPAAIGMGTQTYEAGEATSRIVPKAYDYKYTGGERPFADTWRR